MEPLSLLLSLVVTSATTSVPAPAYELRLELDVPVLVIAGMVSFGWILRDELPPPHCAPDGCRRDDVFALDRFAAGRFDTGFRAASDVAVASTYGLAALTLLIDEGPRRALNDAVVVAQAVLLSNAVGATSALASRRPRPLAYGTTAPLEERLRGNSSLSFFSGHTAGSFAAAVAMFQTMRRLHPSSAVPYVVLGVGLAAASFIGVSRVLAGDHFPTDVIAGAAVGVSVGLIVPALHDAPVQLSGSVEADGGLIRVGGRF